MTEENLFKEFKKHRQEFPKTQPNRRKSGALNMNTRFTTVLLLVLFALPVVLFADEKPKKKAAEDKNALQVPLKIRQLQKQLEETEVKIKELASDADPAARMDKELKSLKEQRDEEWKILDEGIRNELEAAIESEPDKSAVGFMPLCPEGIEKSAFLKCVAKGQEFLQKKAKLQGQLEKAPEKSGAALEKLENPRESIQIDLEEQLPAFQENLFLSFMKKCKGYRDKDADLPVDELEPMVNEIQKYDFGWDEEIIWQIADDVWKRCRPAVGSSRKKLTRQMIDRHIVRQALNHKPGEEITKTNCGVDFVFHWCPPGEFTMGGSNQQPGYDDKFEKPHKVTLTHGFWMLKTEVTQDMWYAVMKTNPSEFKGGDLPVENVTWNDCVAFCQKLTEESGLPISLPTDAQWEYAFRAGSQDMAIAQETLDKIAWIKVNSNEEPQSVASLEPNAWGIFDMAGNVWEWTSDYLRKYSDQPEIDPQNPPKSKFHVIRGSGFMTPLQHFRISTHFHEKSPDDPTFALNDLGFRVIWTPAETSKAMAMDDEGDARDSRRGRNQRMLVSALDGSLWMTRGSALMPLASRSAVPIHRKPLQSKNGAYEISLKASRLFGERGFGVLISSDETFCNGYMVGVGDEGNKVTLRKYQNYEFEKGGKLKEMECKPHFSNATYTLLVRVQGNKVVTYVNGKLWILDGTVDSSFRKTLNVAIYSMSGAYVSFTNMRVKSGRRTLCDTQKDSDLPVSYASVFVPSALLEQQAWKYTTKQPDQSWKDKNFDDSQWSSGKSMFGNIPNTSLITTQWGDQQIWMRKKFTVDKIPEELVLLVSYCDHCEIFLNGTRINELNGNSNRRYRRLYLPENARNLLQKGENVLAVYCRDHTQQDHYLDVGLVGAKKKPEGAPK